MYYAVRVKTQMQVGPDQTSSKVPKGVAGEKWDLDAGILELGLGHGEVIHNEIGVLG